MYKVKGDDDDDDTPYKETHFDIATQSSREKKLQQSKANKNGWAMFV